VALRRRHPRGTASIPAAHRTWLDVIDTELAVDLVVWSGIGLLLVLGYAGGRLGGATPRGALIHGVLLASLGVVVLAVKSLH
jgi:hypothetical protein